MATILIVESNPAGLQPAAPDFVAAMARIDPSLDHRIVAPYDAPVSQTDLTGIDGVIFTGSGVDWGVDAPDAASLRRVMEMVFADGLPSYGSCNGMRTAAYVLGGRSDVSLNGREAGVAQGIRLTREGERHPFMTGRRNGFAAPCIHRHEVTRLPEGAILLAGNAHSPVQAFAYDLDGVRFWGVQYHPEVTPVGMAETLDGVGDCPRHLLDDLRQAETDADAARRLGATSEDLQPDRRLTELRNWLESLPGQGA